jgi:metal-responsive CopG/Arc/MetJ family transcriptional regulator
MRTIVDIPDALVAELDAHAQREQVSRAEAVRRAIAEYVAKRAVATNDLAFGAWKGKKIDALTFVDRLRDEW